MKKYLAKLLFKVHSNEVQTEVSEFDEQIRLVEAMSQESAFHKARSIGKQEEEAVTGIKKQIVTWQFIDVAEMYALETVKDGEQVYSTTHKITDQNSYIHYIKQKSMELQVKQLHFA